MPWLIRVLAYQDPLDELIRTTGQADTDLLCLTKTADVTIAMLLDPKRRSYHTQKGNVIRQKSARLLRQKSAMILDNNRRC